MVVTEDFTMSRTDEVQRITENVYKNIMEQFNPCLRNFIAMGKNYEKALSSVTFAAKGYFDALVRMGELASESQGSKDLGDVLFQMAEVHRQIQVQLEEMLKCFHNELLSELEKKVDLDARYLTAALKKYQMEHKSKGESLEKCQGELKKLRRKSQGSKNPSKYGEKEMQYVETISCKQSELETFIAEGYKTALSEERRRYCFLVDRQCAVAKNSSAYHGKGKDLLTQKIPVWQQACSDPNKLPERAMLLAQQMTSGSSTLISSPLHSSKGNLVISDPIPGAQPLPVPPELAAFMGSGLGHQGRLMGPDGMSLVNGTTGVHGEEYWTDGGVSQGRPPSPQSQSQTQSQPQRQVSDVYSNTLPVRRPQPAKNKTSVGETRTLPRSSSMAAGLEKNGRARVQAIFSHAAGDNSTLLSFTEGDIITLLVPEARDGWHYGENEKNKMRGWFPFSYTRVLPDSDSEKLKVNLHHGKSSSTGNLLEREDMSLPMPDYGLTARLLAQSLTQTRPRPYSMAGFAQPALEDYDNHFAARSGEELFIVCVPCNSLSLAVSR
ncbi:brain-specific angiogenesis inhibitor 1-associated protein 2a isoform X2 [Misgurnus anguillicaudatus]|uniref:brain-specific angiogenesis inhibitor 1-associated protein 2a isoform X2 n=1 Tax=Misgurnus anguillicaudatus TaxID=75329 RepID=UPI002435F2AB|nr:brain-specific angiogenesis inhibitor 1-associated protein 2a isoform X2 [Misgurnus anguillicaudatus]XP_055043475.1 brain-specific angiogenesis inhibitor 1-associated protein 2a isoform X2 [Misgurnus anguillicaudatus]